MTSILTNDRIFINVNRALSLILKVKSIKNEEEVNDKVIFSKRITILSTSIYISAIWIVWNGFLSKETEISLDNLFLWIREKTLIFENKKESLFYKNYT